MLVGSMVWIATIPYGVQLRPLDPRTIYEALHTTEYSCQTRSDKIFISPLALQQLHTAQSGASQICTISLRRC